MYYSIIPGSSLQPTGTVYVTQGDKSQVTLNVKSPLSTLLDATFDLKYHLASLISDITFQLLISDILRWSQCAFLRPANSATRR